MHACGMYVRVCTEGLWGKYEWIFYLSWWRAKQPVKTSIVHAFLGTNLLVSFFSPPPPPQPRPLLLQIFLFALTRQPRRRRRRSGCGESPSLSVCGRPRGRVCLRVVLSSTVCHGRLLHNAGRHVDAPGRRHSSSSLSGTLLNLHLSFFFFS